MKTLKFFSIALVAIAMASCGGDKNSAKLEIKPELGDLEKYMSIDDTEAVISLSEVKEDGEVYMQIACTLPVTVKEGVASNYGFYLEGEILDKNMNPICDFPGTFRIESKSDYDNGGYSHFLTKGSYRATASEQETKNKWDANPNANEMWKKIREEGKYLVIKNGYSSAKFKAYDGTGSGDSDQDEEEIVEEAGAETLVEASEVSSSSSSGQNWDEVLDEYEKYVTKLASYYKKAVSGDMTALTEYTSLLESAESLEKKLENAKSDMTAAQAARLNKIAAKMASSMM